jgi:hypothetical protein
VPSTLPDQDLQQRLLNHLERESQNEEQAEEVARETEEETDEAEEAEEAAPRRLAETSSQQQQQPRDPIKMCGELLGKPPPSILDQLPMGVPDNLYLPPPERTAHNLYGAGGQNKIAVYTYNFGAYSKRKDFIPHVPPTIDAFLFTDRAEGYGQWVRQGWNLLPYTQVTGTPYVSDRRLTTKKLKFQPPSWLLDNYDWLVSHDMKVFVDLAKLEPFLARHEDKPLVLLDWCHWNACNLTAYELFDIEIDAMLNTNITNRTGFITTSRDQCIEYRDKVARLRNDTARNFKFPHYYELSFHARNLRHAKQHKVKKAYNKIYKLCHDIERDQFLMPEALWEYGLEDDVAVEQLFKLEEDLGFCWAADERR